MLIGCLLCRHNRYEFQTLYWLNIFILRVSITNGHRHHLAYKAHFHLLVLTHLGSGNEVFSPQLSTC